MTRIRPIFRLVFSIVSLAVINGVILDTCYGVCADDFDTWSTGRTLRFDYYHTGTSGSEYISFDEVRLEGEWPGSRSRLVDRLELGECLFEVQDASDGRLLYSRGFDSIFDEWQTTAEAGAGTWRTFHESQRFPEPRREVRLVLKRRSVQGEPRTIFSMAFRPDDVMVNRTPKSNTRPWAVFQNGEPAQKLDLLVLGDGYAASEMEKYHRDVKRLTGILFDTEPFRSHRSHFNVWGLDMPAAESGITDPRRGHWRDSPLGFRSNAFGIDRYALSYENRSIHDTAALAPYDSIMIVTNTAKHCGGGIYNLWANAPADSPTASYVFVHEVGHSLAGLADEYYSAQVAYQYPDGKPAEPRAPNATAVVDTARLKWRDLIESGTPIPTPWRQEEYDRAMANHQARVRELEARNAADDNLNRIYTEIKRDTGSLLASEKYVGKTGLFEGANYRAKQIYRPEVDCIMFSHNRGEFCRVCTRAIIRAIQQFSE